MCPNEESFDDITHQHIKQFGFSVILIEPTDYLPGFAYTVGLMQTWQHPDMICIGLPVKTLHEVINNAVALLKERGPLPTNIPYPDIFDTIPAQFIRVKDEWLRDYVGYAINYYKTVTPEFIQLVWPDRNEHFPWEKEYDEDLVHIQPLLDRNVDFKFMEARNCGVFTTRQWVENQAPILRVVHDHDGDWQFLTAEYEQEDARLVALEQLVLKDPSLNELFNLDYGETAERPHAGAGWERAQFEPEEES